MNLKQVGHSTRRPMNLKQVGHFTYQLHLTMNLKQVGHSTYQLRIPMNPKLNCFFIIQFPKSPNLNFIKFKLVQGCPTSPMLIRVNYYFSL